MLNMSNSTTMLDRGPHSLTRSHAELVVGCVTFFVIILMTVVGNGLVILSIFTYKPLHKVQNYFMVSLAAADLSVALLVMPFHIAKFLLGKWVFGLAMCQIWLTLDILTCTASILNLCAIALDRYWAITNPLVYSNRRTAKLVLGMIGALWALSALISVPPSIGWNDWSVHNLAYTCELTKQRGFVVYSAFGSFYIPLMVMTTVYIKIFIAARHRLRKRTGAVAGSTAWSKSRGPCPSSASPPSVASRKAPLRALFRGLNNDRVPLNAAASEQSSIALSTPRKWPKQQESQPVGPFDCPSSGHSVKPGTLLIVTDIDDKINATTEIDKSSPSQEEDENQFASDNGVENTAKKKINFENEKLNMNRGHNFIGPTQKKSNVNLPPVVRPLEALNVQKVYKDRERISVSREKKAAKTLAIIMGVFVLCWLPFFIIYLIDPFCEKCRVHPKVEEMIVWLGYINSAINPVIYTIFNMDFRKAFSKYLCFWKKAHQRSVGR